MNRNSRKVTTALATLTLLGFALSADAQVDTNTTLYLSFDNTLDGGQGEMPVSSGVSFVAGLKNSAAYFPVGNILSYSSAGNISSFVGTLEFFVKPDWNGDALNDFNFLVWGSSGGMLFSKDAASNLRGIFNRFGQNGNPETGVASSISNWRAGEWHHLAYTWNDVTKSIKMYIDGALAQNMLYNFNLPAIPDASFRIGHPPLEAALDELRISSVERSADEIMQYYRSVVPDDIATVSGTVALQSSLNGAQPIIFTFRPQTGTPLTRMATLNTNGTYSFADIPANRYTLSIKGAKWLRKNIVVDARVGNVNNVNLMLLAGDSNDDNFADIADLLALIAHYNKSSPNIGYSDAADFNCDGSNDINDLLLLVANYNKQGDPL